MNTLYRTIGLTKQAFHQRLNHYLQMHDEQQQLLKVINEIRGDHPKLSSRQIYFMIDPKCMGRDKFEAFCFENGFKIPRKQSFTRTTNSLGVTRFSNLLTEKELTGVNQVWVSDITYYRIGDKFYYLTFIMDLYSRYLVGYSASEDLLTENTTMPALKMAIKKRSIKRGLILHSDGGGQYYSKEFKDLTTRCGIRNSMGKNAYENPNAERINGTIKNDYLQPYNPKNFTELLGDLKRAVKNYHLRPHRSHNRLSPGAFEELLTHNVEMCTSQTTTGGCIHDSKTCTHSNI
jgi:putative transposase